MMSKVRLFFRKKVWAVVAFSIYQNLMNLIQGKGAGYTFPARPAGRNPESDASYAHHMVREYARARPPSQWNLKGKTVLELGPGENKAVALLMDANQRARVA